MKRDEKKMTSCAIDCQIEERLRYPTSVVIVI